MMADWVEQCWRLFGFTLLVMRLSNTSVMGCVDDPPLNGYELRERTTSTAVLYCSHSDTELTLHCEGTSWDAEAPMCARATRENADTDIYGDNWLDWESNKGYILIFAVGTGLGLFTSIAFLCCVCLCRRYLNERKPPLRPSFQQQPPKEQPYMYYDGRTDTVSSGVTGTTKSTALSSTTKSAALSSTRGSQRGTNPRAGPHREWEPTIEELEIIDYNAAVRPNKRPGYFAYIPQQSGEEIIGLDPRGPHDSPHNMETGALIPRRASEDMLGSQPRGGPEPSTSRRVSEDDILNRGGARPRDNTGPHSNTGPRDTQTPSKRKSVDWELPGASRTVQVDGPPPTASLMNTERSSSDDSDHFYNKPV